MTAEATCVHEDPMVLDSYTAWCPPCGAIFFAKAWHLPERLNAENERLRSELAVLDSLALSAEDDERRASKATPVPLGSPSLRYWALGHWECVERHCDYAREPISFRVNRL